MFVVTGPLIGGPLGADPCLQLDKFTMAVHVRSDVTKPHPSMIEDR